MLTYRLRYHRPLTGFVPVEMLVDVLDTSLVTLQLAAWRPGRYELQNYSQKLRHLRVTDEADRAVPVRKLTKDRWEVQPGAARQLTVRYDFHAHQLDAGGSWVDDEQLYINPVNCLLAVVGHEQEAAVLELDVPADWQVACGLPFVAADPRVRQVSSYDELADSPLIASAALRHLAYDVAGHIFHVWLQGAGPVDEKQLLADFRAFTQVQLALFGGFPLPEYHFLVQLLPEPFYHGVEHLTSTVLALGPGRKLGTWPLYKELLGVASHELFHVWNVKLIRPAELQPYDFTRESYFRTGYVAEGLTTYYGDRLLARAGVFSPEQYLQELNAVVARHYADAGEQHLSVADSSLDLWADGYKLSAPHRKVSIYHKGCLAALLLDLKLRELSAGQRSLDDVMRALWTEFGQTGRGYSPADYQRVVEQVAGQPLPAYFADVIDGTAPLAPLLDKALRTVGAELTTRAAAVDAEHRFGFRTAARPGELAEVTALAFGAAAEEQLMVGDLIVAADGQRLGGGVISVAPEAAAVTLTLFRRRQLLTVTVPASSTGHYGMPEVRVTDRAAWAAFLQS